MPRFLLDLHFRTESTCRRVVEAADREEAERVGNRLVRDLDPSEFDDDPRYPATYFCAGVTDINEGLSESLYRRIVDDWIVLRDLPGMRERLRSFIERSHDGGKCSTGEPLAIISGGLDDR